jgi:hypothetical protein
MFGRLDADQLVTRYLDEHEIAEYDFDSPLARHEDHHDQKLVVVRVDEYEFGWLYFYDSSRHVATGDTRYALVGNAPLIVDKNDGKLYITGTTHPVEHYVEQFRRGVKTDA